MTVFFFFLMMWKLTKAGPLYPLLGSEPQMHNPTCQNLVLGNPGELQIGLEPKMSGSTNLPKPPTTRLYPDGLTT